MFPFRIANSLLRGLPSGFNPAVICLAILAGLFLVDDAQAAWHLRWRHQLPKRKPAWEHTQRMTKDTSYAPTVAASLVFVGCEHNGALLALDGKTGQERWRFYTAAPIRFAPESGDSPPNSSGRYTIRLHFGDSISTRPGQRIFNVSLEGKIVLRKFDIVKESGAARKPLVLEFENIEVQGPLDIQLTAEKGDTLLSGVEMIRAK